MEEKIKRESRIYLDKLFKQHDTLCCGGITLESMRKIVKTMISDYDKDELEEIMAKHLKDSKYTVLNKDTKEFDVKFYEESIDFPSAQYIVVHFLIKLERRNTDAFSGKGLITFNDFGRRPSKALVDQNREQKRRLY